MGVSPEKVELSNSGNMKPKWWKLKLTE